MGSAQEGSDRARQLDFRCAAVRRKTGGSGIVLLSATPAKNSPLEFYNLIQYVDPGAWSRMGIHDPEQFIDRYVRTEIKQVLNTRMEVESRSAAVGFMNLHELRDVIFRYGEFKTAEEVGLKLPEPKVEMVEVDMDPRQEQKYTRYVAEIADALKNPMKGAGTVLGLLARLALVAVHADLDGGFDWKNAGTVGDPNSPKFSVPAHQFQPLRSRPALPVQTLGPPVSLCPGQKTKTHRPFLCAEPAIHPIVKTDQTHHTAGGQRSASA
jgi:hypothetical protein